MSGFDAALLAEAQTAADAAGDAIVTAFREAATQVAESLASVGSGGFDEITTAADTAVADLETTFGGAATSVAEGLASAAETGSAALEGIGEGVADQLVLDFSDVGNTIAAEIESGANAADAALTGLGAGAGDELSGEFEGVGATIESEVSQGASGGEQALTNLGSEGVLAAQTIADAFQGSAGKIIGALAAIGVGFGLAGAFHDAEEVNRILATTDQLIENTGGSAGVTADEILALGDSLERVTNFESEATQEAANLLLGFKNVRNEVGEGNAVFDRAVLAGGDLAAVMNSDLSSATRNLGRALEDPVRGVNQLRRANIIFTEEQKDLVRSLVEQGDVLGAQTLILDEVESRVGGVAEATAQASDRIRNSLGNIGEEFGAGLLPAMDEFADRAPELVDELGPAFRDLGEALGGVFGAGIDALLELSPLLGVTTDLLTILLPILELSVDIIGAIPSPVLETVAAVLLMNKALDATRAAIALSGIGAALASAAVPAGAVSGAFTGAAAASVGLRGGLAALVAGLNPVTVGIAATAGSVLLYNKVIGDAENEGRAFVQSIRDGFDPATASLDELVLASSQLDDKIVTLQADVDDSFFGRNTVNRDFNAALNEGVEGLQEFQAEIDAAIVAQRQLELESQFGDLATPYIATGEAIASLREESSDAASVISNIRLSGDLASGTFTNLAMTLDEATLSEEGMANAAKLLGTDVESLQGFIDGVTGSIDAFVETAVSGFPSVAQAFRDGNEDSEVSAREFITGLQEDTAELAEFFDNLGVLIDAGFTEIAGVLAGQGAEAAGQVAEELATAAQSGNKRLLLETQIGLDNRNREIAESTAFVRDRLGPEFIRESGEIALRAAAAFGVNFDPGEQVRIAGELAATTLDEQGQELAVIAFIKGEDAAREYGAGFNIDQETIDAAVAAGKALEDNAPVAQAQTAGARVGLGFGDGLILGVQAKIDEIGRNVADLIRDAAAAALEAAEADSPSRLFMRIGGFLGEGLAIGIESESDAVVREAEKIIKRAADTFTDVRFDPIRFTGLDESAGAASAFAPSLLVRANDSVPDDLIPWQLRFDQLADALANSRQFPTSSTPVPGDGTSPAMIIAAGAIVVNEAHDGLDTATEIGKRLRAEVFLQRRS